MAVSGVSVNQMSELNNILNDYCKQAFPANSKNFDILKSQIDEHIKKLDPNVDPGWWETLWMIIVYLGGRVPVAIERRCSWWQFWCWW